MAMSRLFREWMVWETWPPSLGRPAHTSRAGGKICRSQWTQRVLEKSRQAPEKEACRQRNWTSHLPIRGSLVVARYCGGQTVPETDWETWHLSGQGPQTWQFPVECLIKVFTFGGPWLPQPDFQGLARAPKPGTFLLSALLNSSLLGPLASRARFPDSGQGHQT